MDKKVKDSNLLIIKKEKTFLNQMERYERQELVEGIGKIGQKKIYSTKVAVVGLGALGTVVSNLLIRSGILNIILVDRDFVELTNLQRQTLYDESDVGRLKVFSAKEKLSHINSKSKIVAINLDINNENITELEKPDIIFACTDNFESKFLLNDYCKKNKITMIFGSLAGWTGHVFTVLEKGPCLRCVFPDKTGETCETTGVLNTTSNIIASLMVDEGIKLITNNNPSPKLIHLNLKKNTLLNIDIIHAKDCSTCNGHYVSLQKNQETRTVKLCGSDSFMFYLDNFEYDSLMQRYQKKKGFSSFRDIFHIDDVSVFRDGRVLIHAKDETDAKKKLKKYI